MKTLIQLLGLTIAALAFTGCANVGTIRGEQAYAPTMPQPARAPEHSGGAIYQAGHELFLFEDIKARRVGDMLTVVLVEKTDAKKSASTSTAKESDVSVAAPTVFGHSVTINGNEIFENEISGSSEFDGSGDSNQSNELNGSITVTVAQVLPNGTLLVQGEKWIGINQGQEYIRLRGMVRPVDVRTDNTVLSTQLANVEINYGGTGTLADSNAAGWMTRFFQHPIWPF